MTYVERIEVFCCNYAEFATDPDLGGDANCSDASLRSSRWVMAELIMAAAANTGVPTDELDKINDLFALGDGERWADDWPCHPQWFGAMAYLVRSGAVFVTPMLTDGEFAQ